MRANFSSLLVCGWAFSVGDASVGCPAGVPDPGRPVQPVLGDFLYQDLDPADLLRNLDAAPLKHGDARGVIPPSTPGV